MKQKTIRDAHCRALEAMYLSEPNNQFYRPRIVISKDQVDIEIDQRYFTPPQQFTAVSISS